MDRGHSGRAKGVGNKGVGAWLAMILSLGGLLVAFVRRQSLSDFVGRFVTEALVRSLFEFRRQRFGAATGVVGLSAF